MFILGTFIFFTCLLNPLLFCFHYLSSYHFFLVLSFSHSSLLQSPTVSLFLSNLFCFYLAFHFRNYAFRFKLQFVTVMWLFLCFNCTIFVFKFLKLLVELLYLLLFLYFRQYTHICHYYILFCLIFSVYLKIQLQLGCGWRERLLWGSFFVLFMLFRIMTKSILYL